MNRTNQEDGRSALALPLTSNRQPDMPPNYPLERGERPVLKAGAQLLRGDAWAPHADKGGCNFFAIPKFMVRVI